MAVYEPAGSGVVTVTTNCVPAPGPPAGKKTKAAPGIPVTVGGGGKEAPHGKAFCTKKLLGNTTVNPEDVCDIVVKATVAV